MGKVLRFAQGGRESVAACPAVILRHTAPKNLCLWSAKEKDFSLRSE